MHVGAFQLLHGCAAVQLRGNIDCYEMLVGNSVQWELKLGFSQIESSLCNQNSAFM